MNTTKSYKTSQEIIWQFIRRDLAVLKFANWVYENDNLEEMFGQDFYLEIISMNFNNKVDVYDLREKLEDFMVKKFPLSCGCPTLSNVSITNMGSPDEKFVWQSLREVKKYGESLWWQSLHRCNECKTYWLIASEERDYDINCYIRLNSDDAKKIVKNNIWPKVFTTYEGVQAICRHSNKFIPFVDSSYDAAGSVINSVKKANPEITNAELASLLAIDEDKIVEIQKCIEKEVVKHPWWKFW